VTEGSESVVIKEETAQQLEPDWSADLQTATEHADQSLKELSGWQTRMGKLQSQLAAVRAEQVAALEDHSSDSSERVERIATAQIREKVIAADLEHERGPRTRLVNALRDALKHLGQPAQLAYMRERERRVDATTLELRKILDPGIVQGLESIEEPGHAMSDHMRRWPSMLEFAAGLHSNVRALDAVQVTMPNWDSYSREVNDEELSLLIGSASGFLAAIGRLQTEINSTHERRI
jgi:hypothetical protein